MWGDSYRGRWKIGKGKRQLELTQIITQSDDKCESKTPKSEYILESNQANGVKLLTVLKQSDEVLTKREGKAHFQTIRKCFLNQ